MLGGLLRPGSFTRLTKSDGLPGDVVYGILEDDLGRLWLSTNDGLGRHDPGTDRWASFDVHDGLQGPEFSQISFCRGADGTMYFGGVHAALRRADGELLGAGDPRRAGVALRV